MTTQTSISPGQEREILRLSQETAIIACKKLNLSKDAIQRVIEKPADFQMGISSLIRKLSVNNNQFASEVVKSTYKYPSSFIPQKVADQAKILKKYFPDYLGGADETFDIRPATKLNETEGWFAILKWQLVGKTYNEATQKILGLIKKQYNGKFLNLREKTLGIQYFREYGSTAKQLEVVAEQQIGYDILVVEAQFGLSHRGSSIRRSRNVLKVNEFMLGPFEVACMLLTHPQRLQTHIDLGIDCAGAEYSPDADDDFWQAPYFTIDSVSGQQVLVFSTGSISRPSPSSGAVSAFLPQ